MDSDLKAKIRNLGKDNSTRYISKKLGISRTQVQKVLDTKPEANRWYQNKWLRRGLYTVATLVIIPIAYNHFFNPNNSIKEPQGIVQYENGSNQRLQYLLSKFAEIDVDNLVKDGEQKGYFGEILNLKDEGVLIESDPKLVRLDDMIADYRKTPSKEMLEKTLDAFKNEDLHDSAYLQTHLDGMNLTKKVNDNYDQNREKLLEFIGPKLPEIYDRLKDLDREVGGYFTLDDTFDMKWFGEDSESDEIKSIKQILSGDFTCFDKVVDITKGNLDSEINVSDLVQSFVYSTLLSDELQYHKAVAKKIQGFEDQINSVLDLSRSRLEAYCSGSFDFRSYMHDIKYADNVVTHWHNHPNIDKEYEIDRPSESDLNVSCFIGNGLVFSMVKDGMNIYEYKFDKWDKVLEYRTD